MRDWWEANVHYTVYDPDALGRQPDMIDTFRVAEAAIYSADGTPKIGLYFLVTAQELYAGVTKQAAVAGAERVMPNVVRQWQTRMEEQEGAIQVFHSWRGEEFWRRPVRS